MNKNNMGFGQKGPKMLTAIELELIAAAIVTFGDAIGAVAIVRAMEEEAQVEISLQNKDEELIRMKKQIDYLTNELSKIKSQMA
ncbi:hypothetical protein [Paenisporosarcina sp. OV554]|uniref:hypothetical protein n=1 Tax=Paenisporosarcina sp. OV554 TaxID=2135694 RepID=UPI000D3C72C8|nr:hypothetical protein [Paenisporosarcina sp. OV554]PUB06329.1 hypothetical protein C8K15_1498 [Paenisporosarcina sp. OV554]